MPCRNMDNLGKFQPTTPTTSNSQPSLFFGGCELEDPLGEQQEIFEEPVGEEEETIPIDTMAKNKNERGDRERIEDVFPIIETNGDSKMKNISPFSLLHFNCLTLEDPETLLFEFSFVCRTYDYTSNDQNLKLFPSTLKEASCTHSWVYLGILSPLGLRCNKLSITGIGTTIGPKIPKRKFLE